jgi:GMP synthase (glutamine-hydrolysing)
MAAAPSAAVAVVDPAAGAPELDCFNALAERAAAAAHAGLALSYHLPALHGMDSLRDLERRTPALAGIVLLGSAASANGDAPWQRALNEWLAPKLRQGVPVLGLCYGHQLLARLLPGGGKVGPVWPDGAACIGLRQLELAPDPLWSSGALAAAGSLVCSHKEGVTRLPDGVRALATVRRGGPEGASETFVDAMAHETLPIWGFQPHCEATGGFLQNNGVEGLSAAERDAAFRFGHGIVDAFVAHCVQRRSGGSGGSGGSRL